MYFLSSLRWYINCLALDVISSNVIRLGQVLREMHSKIPEAPQSLYLGPAITSGVKVCCCLILKSTTSSTVLLTFR